VETNGIIAEEHWSNPNSSISVEKARGICVYFPNSNNAFDQSYSSIAIGRTTYWDEFVSIN